MKIVYVLVNQAMPGIVKIGFTTDLPKRLKSLDNTAMPYPFECFHAATVEDMRRIEAQLHRVFADRRIRENREFFTVDPECVVAAIELAGGQDVTPGTEEYIEDAADRASVNERRQIRSAMSFEKLGIPVGSELEYIYNAGITCIVAAGNKVTFEGEDVSISRLTRLIFDQQGRQMGTANVRGPRYWLYQGEKLNERRYRMEDEARDGKT